MSILCFLKLDKRGDNKKYKNYGHTPILQALATVPVTKPGTGPGTGEKAW